MTFLFELVNVIAVKITLSPNIDDIIAGELIVEVNMETVDDSVILVLVLELVLVEVVVLEVFVVVVIALHPVELFINSIICV